MRSRSVHLFSHMQGEFLLTRLIYFVMINRPDMTLAVNHGRKTTHQTNKTNEPRHEKTNILYMRKQKRRYREADQRLCFCYIDSKIPLLSKSKISSI